MENINTDLARKYFEETKNVKLKPFQVKIKAENFLRKFILEKDFEI